MLRRTKTIRLCASKFVGFGEELHTGVRRAQTSGHIYSIKLNYKANSFLSAFFLQPPSLQTQTFLQRLSYFFFNLAIVVGGV